MTHLSTDGVTLPVDTDSRPVDVPLFVFPTSSGEEVTVPLKARASIVGYEAADAMLNVCPAPTLVGDE